VQPRRIDPTAHVAADRPLEMKVDPSSKVHRSTRALVGDEILNERRAEQKYIKLRVDRKKCNPKARDYLEFDSE
jgi:hypothetical protein